MVGDVEIVAASCEKEEVIEAFFKMTSGWGPQKLTIVDGTPKATVARPDGLKISLRVVRPSEYGSALIDMSGRYHSDAIRRHALYTGSWLSFGPERKQYSYTVAIVSLLTTRVPREAEPLETEDDVYSRLGLNFIPPEKREQRGILAQALRASAQLVS